MHNSIMLRPRHLKTCIRILFYALMFRTARFLSFIIWNIMGFFFSGWNMMVVILAYEYVSNPLLGADGQTLVGPALGREQRSRRPSVKVYGPDWAAS